MKKFICILFFHRFAQNTDSGYHTCKRCGWHEYYDYDSRVEYGILNPILWYRRTVVRWYYRIKYWYIEKNSKLPF